MEEAGEWMGRVGYVEILLNGGHWLVVLARGRQNLRRSVAAHVDAVWIRGHWLVVGVALLGTAQLDVAFEVAHLIQFKILFVLTPKNFDFLNRPFEVSMQP
jgi:hypothetical protein